jgi:CUB domain
VNVFLFHVPANVTPYFSCQFVELDFKFLATDLLKDNVTVYDGSDENATIFTQLSGQPTLNKFTSTQKNMFVSFTSDSWQSGMKGVQAAYRTMGK